MPALKVLFVGGTGIISAASARRAVEQDAEVYLLDRGASIRPTPAGAAVLHADITDSDAVRSALGEIEYDVVVDFLAFTPEDIDERLALFAHRTGQYVFISSASAYQTPPEALPVRETTPLSNPYWQYSRSKAAAEARLAARARSRKLPHTIVRPSHTYDETMVPFDGGWTVVQRMRDGKPVLVPGDGTSLWTITHSRDFAIGLVGLLGNKRAFGEAVHITADHALPWNAIYQAMAEAAGADPDLVHVASDAINATDHEWGAALLGDKANSMVFDNSKIKELVPSFAAVTPFATGAAEIVAWHDADRARKRVDAAMNTTMDKLAAAYRPRAL